MVLFHTPLMKIVILWHEIGVRSLKGFNEQYSTVRSQIMLMNPLSIICKVYSLLVQQESQALVPFDESKLSVATNSSFQGREGLSNCGRG
jgi:hypothetical protein